MSNELETYGGNDLAPYSPGGDIAPITPGDSWGDLSPDYLSERLAPPSLDPTVERNVAQIADVFTTDMAGLGFVQRDIDKCISFFKQMLVNPPQRMPAKRHSYNTYQYSHDAGFQAFANYAATQRFPQELIQSVAYWLQQLEDFQHGVGRFAGQQGPVSSNVEDQLTDSQHEAVVVANQRAAAQTMGRLRDMWGSSFEANMRVVQNHFASLTTAEQEHLSQFSTGWIRGTNTFEILTSLYAQAVQAHTIPRDGASIERELQAITKYMKENRAAYLKDDLTQARFRELLNLQSGGR